jgi:hypothetical protein
MLIGVIAVWQRKLHAADVILGCWQVAQMSRLFVLIFAALTCDWWLVANSPQ